MQIAGPGLILPSFPLGGFNLKSTGKTLYDGDSSVRSKDSSPQETRASFPLSDKEKTHNVVVENLLEKQLSKADVKVSSLPTTALDREVKGVPDAMDEEEDSECFSGSTNSLDEIEEVTRRVRNIFYLFQSTLCETLKCYLIHFPNWHPWSVCTLSPLAPLVL